VSVFGETPSPSRGGRGWGWFSFRNANKPETSDRWIALDLETTGLDPATDRIIEIGAVAIHRGEIVLHDYFHRVLAESGEVTAANRIIHGVTAKEQYDGTALNEALDALLFWMADAPFVGFFADFDVKFLRAALAGHTNKLIAKSFASQRIDMQRIARAAFPDIKAKSLGEWSAALKLPIKKQHRALADALATAHLLQRVLATMPKEKRTFAKLQCLESVAKWVSTT
jgi:DNA polymerase III subunit epsilon